MLLVKPIRLKLQRNRQAAVMKPSPVVRKTRTSKCLPPSFLRKPAASALRRLQTDFPGNCIVVVRSDSAKCANCAIVL